MVSLRDRRPVMHAGAAKGIHPHADLGAANSIDVEHIAKIAYVGVEEVMAMSGVAAQGPRVGNPLHALQAILQELIGPGFDPTGHANVGGPAIGRVVFESAVVGRVVRGGNDDAIGQAGRTRTVIGQDRVGDRRGGGVFVILGQHDVNAICRQDFERAGASGHGQGVRVDAKE